MHNASVSVKGLVELFSRAVREDELHRRILAFLVSHDNEAVRIYGQYALINKSESSFYRHTIRKFDFTEQDGKNKWDSYKFTRNVYDIFVPIHLERIRAAIDQLPDPEVFLVEPLSYKSIVDLVKQDDSQPAASYLQEVRPESLHLKLLNLSSRNQGSEVLRGRLVGKLKGMYQGFHYTTWKEGKHNDYLRCKAMSIPIKLKCV